MNRCTVILCENPVAIDLAITHRNSLLAFPFAMPFNSSNACSGSLIERTEESVLVLFVKIPLPDRCCDVRQTVIILFFKSMSFHSDSKIKLDYTHLGTPTDYPHIESFNGSFQSVRLNMNCFMSLEDTRDKTERWWRDCNEFRPHSVPTYLAPIEFARKSGSESV